MKNESLLTSGLVGNIGIQTLREQRELALQRWEGTGLLEGLNGVVKENIAMLYENQATHMLKESTTSSSSGSYETVAFPVIRRVFSKLLANEIVSVQALNLPLGYLYYMNPRISQRKADGSHYEPNGAYANAPEELERTQFEDVSLYDSFYATGYDTEGTSLFDRSKGAVTVVTGTVTTLSNNNGYVTAVLSGFTNGITDGRGTIIGPQGNVLDTESFLSSLEIFTASALTATGVTGLDVPIGGRMQFTLVPQTWGAPIATQSTPNAVKVVINGTYPGLIDGSGVDGYKPFGGIGTAAFTYTFRTYSNMEEDAEMAEVSFGLDRVMVSVETRKMRSQWTPELQQDVSAFQNIDAEAELTALLSEQMAAEIDREILRDLRRNAAWGARWDYNGLRKQSNTYFGTQKDWNQTLLTKVNQISAQIKKATLRGGASWLVVSTEISAVLDDLTYFQVSDASAESYQYNMGIEKIGSLNGRYQVYVDPYAPANTLLVGHKGSSILETGYIYAPYVPMALTPVLTNYTNFTSVRGIMTRYAKKTIFNRYYGKILCDGLFTFDMNI